MQVQLAAVALLPSEAALTTTRLSLTVQPNANEQSCRPILRLPCRGASRAPAPPALPAAQLQSWAGGVAQERLLASPGAHLHRVRLARPGLPVPAGRSRSTSFFGRHRSEIPTLKCNWFLFSRATGPCRPGSKALARRLSPAACSHQAGASGPCPSRCATKQVRCRLSGRAAHANMVQLKPSSTSSTMGAIACV